MQTLERDVCCNVSLCATREWLITNGIGGYGSGTVANVLTRRYHGLLVAALKPPVARTLLVTKVDEVAEYNGGTYPLYVNRWRYGLMEPDGYRYLEQFRLENGIPVWTYTLGDARLEKRVWMQYGANTTYVHYQMLAGAAPLRLLIRVLGNYRDYHYNTHAGEWQMQIAPVEHGLSVQAYEGAAPYYVLCDRASAADVEVRHVWIRDFYLSLEEYRGYDPFDDNLEVGQFQATLRAGESLTLVASTEPQPSLDGAAAYAARCQYEADLLTCAGNPKEPYVQQLILAADQFIVQRAHHDAPDGRTIIAGYPWFTDWGRDTMISLPGLTLTTRRPAVARQILRTYAHFVDQGMLPNRFTDAGEAPEYNTVDATLWYFEALRAYDAVAHDDELLRELFPVLREIIEWHRRGTRYQIHVDPQDGLLYAGEPGVQLTWMDVKISDWVVTPRIGKPVEVNALWYNALRVMADFAERLGYDAAEYAQAAQQCQAGFARFWYPAGGYCYDVLDTPEGPDPTLRPNQLLAISLPHSALPHNQQRSVVEACRRELLTPYGMRTLPRDDPAYVGRYGGFPWVRDAAYHQGTVWGWLLGVYAIAHWRVYGDPERARAHLLGMLPQLDEHGLGTLSEIFDGDGPYAPRGCIAQAWSVGAWLGAWALVGHV